MADDDLALNGGSRPVPDPTVLTTAAVKLAMEAEEKRVDGLLEVLRERLHGMDTATDLRLRAVDHLPGMMDEKDRCIQDVLDEKFAGVEKQFGALQDRMAEQKKDTKDAVDAAFQAAKDAVNLQTEASEKSIAKSEASTTKQIDALGVQATTAIDALKDQMSDLKISVERITSAKSGGTEATSSIRDRSADNRALVALSISAVLLLIGVISLVIAFRT